MSSSSFFYCVPCFILPEFPSDCNIVKDNSLLLRDILCCYKTSGGFNDHIYWGGQYDPHYEHDIAPQFKMCHKDYRNKIQFLISNGNYDAFYLIFRGNKKYLDGTNTHYITGYYEIDQNNMVLDPDYEDYTLYASDAVMLSDNEAIDISSFLKDTGMYQVKFNSKTHDGKYQSKFINHISEMKDMDNKLQDFIDETIRIEKIFKYYEFEKGLYEVCNKCSNKNICPLVKRVRKYKLCDNLPSKINNIINKHYKVNIDISTLL